MSCSLSIPRFNALIDGIEMTPDLIAGLVYAALIQADVASHELYQTVIPELPHMNRVFPSVIAKKIACRNIFESGFVCETKTLTERLGRRFRIKPTCAFHPEENHVRGGYESTFREPGMQSLAAAIKKTRSAP